MAEVATIPVLRGPIATYGIAWQEPESSVAANVQVSPPVVATITLGYVQSGGTMHIVDLWSVEAGAVVLASIAGFAQLFSP